jgi:hypothetical protein
MSSSFSVDPDPHRAQRFLRSSQNLLRDAESVELALESSFFLAHQACISAMEALMASVGRAISPGEGSTIVLLRETNGALGPTYNDLFESLSIGRQERNEASYAEPTVSEAAAHVMLEDARALVAAVESMISRS